MRWWSGADGLCELTTTAKTHVAELRDGKVELYQLEPEEVGLPKGNLEEMRIDSPEESAQMIREILQGKNQGTPRHVALYNAAGALVVAGKAENLRDGGAGNPTGRLWQGLAALGRTSRVHESGGISYEFLSNAPKTPTDHG